MEIIGAWRSLVARLLWEQEVGGSNPLAPTSLSMDGTAGKGFVWIRYDIRALRRERTFIFFEITRIADIEVTCKPGGIKYA